jgi:hypothetical protein
MARFIRRELLAVLRWQGFCFRTLPFRNGKGWYVGYVLGGPTIFRAIRLSAPTRTIRKRQVTIAGVR